MRRFDERCRAPVKYPSVCAVLFAVLALSPGASPAQERHPGAQTLKVGTLAPVGSTWMDVLRNILFMVEKRTDGRVKFTVYGGGVMGDEPDMVRKMRLDELQVGVFTIQGMSSIAPEMSVLEVPFLFSSYAEVDHIRGTFYRRFEKFYDTRGFVLIAVVDQGFIKIFTSRPVRTPEELDRERMWVWAEEPVGRATVESLGVTGIPLPVPEVLGALQRGTIDSFCTTPLTGLAFQWFSRIKYIIDLDLRYDPGVVVVTRRAWESLRTGDRKIFLDVSRELLPGAFTAIRADQKRAYEAIVDSGVTPITLTPREEEVFRSRTRGVWDALAGKLYPRPLLQEIVRSLEEYRRTRGAPGP